MLLQWVYMMKGISGRELKLVNSIFQGTSPTSLIQQIFRIIHFVNVNSEFRKFIYESSINNANRKINRLIIYVKIKNGTDEYRRKLFFVNLYRRLLKIFILVNSKQDARFNVIELKNILKHLIKYERFPNVIFSYEWNLANLKVKKITVYNVLEGASVNFIRNCLKLSNIDKFKFRKYINFVGIDFFPNGRMVFKIYVRLLWSLIHNNLLNLTRNERLLYNKIRKVGKIKLMYRTFRIYPSAIRYNKTHFPLNVSINPYVVRSLPIRFKNLINEREVKNFRISYISVKSNKYYAEIYYR